jgi:hypothetical protein
LQLRAVSKYQRHEKRWITMRPGSMSSNIFCAPLRRYSAHVHMVGGVLHDVVDQSPNAQREGQVHGGRHKRLRLGPGRLVIVPVHLDVGVMHIHHKADHGAPEQEGHQHPGGQHHRDGLLGGQGCRRHGADPSQSKP